MTAVVVRAGAEHLPLPDGSVDLICTSPPYFGLRSYQDDGRHYDGQVGSEATPAEFMDVLVRCTAEWMRVLKPSGSIFVNLGDKYAGHPSGHKPGADTFHQKDGRLTTSYERGAGAWKHDTIRTKSLLGLPWRYAIRCIDDLGLILRAEVVWSKPNGLPESVTDRVRRSHENWFHFTKAPRYYSAVDEIREAHTGGSHGSGNGQSRRWVTSNAGTNHRALDTDPTEYNPLGKLPGSVWTVPTEPLTLPDVSPLDGRPLPDHFAAFPLEWPRRIVRGWSPAQVCTACGEGRRPVTQSLRTANVGKGAARQEASNAISGGFVRSTLSDARGVPSAAIVGYACACPDTTAPATPGVVVDPFGGTGTVALMAHALGRVGISVDYSHDYSRVARWRTTDRQQLAKALEVTKPEPVAAGQDSLF